MWVFLFEKSFSFSWSGAKMEKKEEGTGAGTREGLFGQKWGLGRDQALAGTCGQRLDGLTRA
jgi:hypothetical protein